jgi:hypothetical protein
VFLDESTGCLTGIALKRSNFSSIQDFIDSIVFADQYHRFIFIDYEGIQNLLDPDQMKDVLEQTRNYLVLTVSVRSAEFHFNRKFLLENYLRLTRSYHHLAFCVVAGHPAYPSVDSQIPVIKAFHYVLSRIRRKTSTPLFLGTENISSNFIIKLIREYNYILPFILHGDPRAIHAKLLKPPLAVYSPLTHLVSNEEAIKLLIEYLLRRRSTQLSLTKKGYFPSIRTTPAKWEELSPGVKKILKSNLQNSVLNSHNFISRIQEFLNNGVQLIVANPVIPHRYFDHVKNFQINTSFKSSNINFKSKLF